MEAELDIQLLRAVTPAKQARILRTVKGEVQSITETLLSEISKGTLPPPVIQSWLGVVRSPAVAVQTFHQRDSAIARRIALKYITKYLRRSSTFQETWDALGGSAGLAKTMTELSVRQLRDLCDALAKTANAGQLLQDGVRETRQKAITELFHLLEDKDRNKAEERPVNIIYYRLLPACTPETALEWAAKLAGDDFKWISHSRTDMYSKGLIRKLREGNWTSFEQHVFQKEVEGKKGKVDLQKLEPYMKASLSFAIRVLEHISKSSDLRRVDPDDWILDLTIPIVRRCAKHRSNVDRHNRVWDIIISALRKHPSLGENLHEAPESGMDNDKTLIDWAVISFNPGPERPHDEEKLSTFFSLIPKHMLSDVYLQTLLDLARPHQKYHFLRLLLLNAPAFKVDIGEPSSTEPLTFKGIHFPHTVFTYLPPVEGLTLFERCLEANPDLSFIYRSPLLRDHINRDGLDRGSQARFDVHILRARLISRAPNEKIILPKDPEAILENLRNTELQERKKNAAKGRETEVRSFWAISALRLAIAMNDYDVVADTFIWARRFNKDPLTVKKLYERDLLEMRETIEMICILPEKPARVDALEERIQKANRILLILNETAIMALREPSLKSSDWMSVYNLVNRATERRIERLDTLQKAMGIDDETLFNAVLRPTIDTVIELETLLLKPEHNRLYQLDPCGLLANMDLAGLKGQVSAPVVRFLDTHARERNHIWEKQRSQEHPALITVGKPYPHGLPVQHLLPPKLQKIAAVAKAPYVQERAEAVVFCDPEIALAPIPEDREVQLAINPFFDRWPNALELWLLASDNEDDRKDRINRAWEYALGPLTNGRMNTQQAQKFWATRGFSPVVEEVSNWVDAWEDRYLSGLPYPRDGNNGPIEWDPDPIYNTTTTKGRELETVTAIDCTLRLPKKLDISETMFDVYQLETPVIGTPGPIWDTPNRTAALRKRLWTPGRFRGGIIDAYITAGLLCLNSRLGSNTSVFMRPYPNEDEPRFPAVYLEEGFLTRNQNRDGDQEGQTLRSLLPWIPAELLAQVATSILDRLQTSDTTSYREFTDMIKLLCRSDRPDLATPLIQRFILDNVDASAWHRELLNPTFLTYLDPKSAEDFFVSLADAILARLKEQEIRKPESSKEQAEDKQPGPPLVKVTTIKMVAQLLKQSEFLRPRVSLDILKQLASESSHIDVRAAAFESLLKSPVSGELKQTVYDIIEELAVPIAGALNEAHPETEEDWQAAENGGPLPEVRDDMVNHPILGLLLSRSNSENWPIIRLARKALKISADNNTRWTKLFLKKHGFDLGGLNLPAIPSLYRGLVLLFDLMDSTDIPVDEFEALRRHALLINDPPESLYAATKAVIESADISGSNEGKHWIEMWRMTDNFPNLVGGNWIAGALADFPYFEKVSYETVTEGMLEDVLMEIMNVHLNKGNTPRFLYNLRLLRPNVDNKSGIVDESRGGGKLMRQLINRIDSLRTPEWQRDPNRQPPRLPDTFRLHFDLLHPPRTAFPAADRVHLPSYVDRVVSLVDYVVKHDTMYHKNFDMIAKSVRQVRNWKLYKAYLFGSPSRFSNPENPTLVDHLRVEMSLSLFEDIKAVGAQDKEDAKLVLGMLDDWAASTVEYLRMQAFNVRYSYGVTKRYGGPGERDWVNNGVD